MVDDEEPGVLVVVVDLDQKHPDVTNTLIINKRMRIKLNCTALSGFAGPLCGFLIVRIFVVSEVAPSLALPTLHFRRLTQ